jgi:hypothetical protein
MESSDLIKAAATTVIGALTKAALEPAVGAGAQLWAWLKARLAGPQAAVAAAVEAAPDDPGAADTVSGLLKSVLHRDPAAMEELRALLGAAGISGTVQVAHASGAGIQVTQIAGSGNAVSYGRPIRAAGPGDGSKLR